MTIESLLKACRDLNTHMDQVREGEAGKTVLVGFHTQPLALLRKSLQESLEEHATLERQAWINQEKQKNLGATDEGARRTQLNQDKQRAKTELQALQTTNKPKEIEVQDKEKQLGTLRKMLGVLQGLRNERRLLMQEAENTGAVEAKDAGVRRAEVNKSLANREQNVLDQLIAAKIPLTGLDQIYKPTVATAGAAAPASTSAAPSESPAAAPAPAQKEIDDTHYYYLVEAGLPAYIEALDHDITVQNAQIQRQEKRALDTLAAYDELLSHLSKAKREQQKTQVPASSTSSPSGPEEEKRLITEDSPAQQLANKNAEIDTQQKQLNKTIKDLQDSIQSRLVEQQSTMVRLNVGEVRAELDLALNTEHGQLIADVRKKKEAIDQQLATLQAAQAKSTTKTAASESKEDEAEKEGKRLLLNGGKSDDKDDAVEMTSQPKLAMPASDDKVSQDQGEIDRVQVQIDNLGKYISKLSELSLDVRCMPDFDRVAAGRSASHDGKTEGSSESSQAVADTRSLITQDSRYAIAERYLQVAFKLTCLMLEYQYQPLMALRLKQAHGGEGALSAFETQQVSTFDVKQYADLVETAIQIGVHSGDTTTFTHFVDWVAKNDARWLYSDKKYIGIADRIAEVSILNPEAREQMSDKVKAKQDEIALAQCLARVCLGDLTPYIPERALEIRDGKKAEDEEKGTAPASTKIASPPTKVALTPEELWKNLMQMMHWHADSRLTNAQIKDVLFWDSKRLHMLEDQYFLLADEEFVSTLGGKPLIVAIAKTAPADLLLLILQRVSRTADLTSAETTYRNDILDAIKKRDLGPYMSAAQREECVKCFDGTFVRSWKNTPFQNIAFIVLAIGLPLMAMFFPPAWLAVAGLGFIATLSIFTQWIGGIIIAALLTKVGGFNKIGGFLIALPALVLSAVLWLGGMLIKGVALIGMALGWMGGKIDNALSQRKDSESSFFVYLAKGLVSFLLVMPAQIVRNTVFLIGEGLRLMGRGLFMAVRAFVNGDSMDKQMSKHIEFQMDKDPATGQARVNENDQPILVPSATPEQLCVAGQKAEFEHRDALLARRSSINAEGRPEKGVPVKDNASFEAQRAARDFRHEWCDFFSPRVNSYEARNLKAEAEAERLAAEEAPAGKAPDVTFV